MKARSGQKAVLSVTGTYVYNLQRHVAHLAIYTLQFERLSTDVQGQSSRNYIMVQSIHIVE